MSFAAIRSTAYSALTVSQVKMQVASSNIANADTAGYTQKIATQVATATGGLSAGVSVTAITSAVDKYLLKDIASSLTALGAATTNASYADSLQNLLGSVAGEADEGTSLANSLATLETALASLSGTPESDTLRALVVDALDTVATQLRETSASVQSLRADADDAIAASVKTVNEQLEKIDGLNDQIMLATARGEPTADLEDQRMVALQAVASQLNVTYSVTSDNQMKIYAGGTALLDSQVHTLSYEPAGYVGSDTVFSAITVAGKDVTTSITSGTIGALIDQRDEVLSAAQSELDALAQTLITTLNTVYNTGTTLPAPSSLTSTSTVSETDTLSATGTLRIALVDADGALASHADFDLTAFADMGQFVDAINATTGMSASIGADGKLTIASTTGDGVVLADIDSQIAGQGVSAHFGFNNLLTGTSAAGLAVRQDVLITPGLLATATLSTADTLTTGATVVGTSSTLANSLQKVLSGSQSIGAAGTLKGQTTTLADYAALIVGGIAGRAETADTALANRQSAYQSLSDAFSSQTGVNVDEETARISELEQQYSTAAQLLSVLNSMFDALLNAVQ